MALLAESADSLRIESPLSENHRVVLAKFRCALDGHRG